MSGRRPDHELKPLFTWRSAICDSGLPPTVRHVALTLSLHMNERGGSCFPTREALARETGLSVRTVDKAIRALEEAGWLEVERPAKERGRGHPNRYTACVPAQEGRTSVALPPEKGEPGARKGERGSPEDDKRTSSTTPQKSSLASLESSSAPQGARAPSSRPPDEIFETLFLLEAGRPYSPAARRRLTRKAAAALNAAAAEIREAGTSADELRAAIAAWPRVMGSATCTAHAVAKHLPRLLAAAKGTVFRAPPEGSIDQIAAEAERLYAERTGERKEAAG